MKIRLRLRERRLLFVLTYLFVCLCGDKVSCYKQIISCCKLKKGCFIRNSLIPSPYSIATNSFYGIDVVSDGVIGDVVVSIGMVLEVSLGIGDVKAVSVVIGGDDVSEPVEFSGVSQPIIAIAKKAMKRMLFMRFTLVLMNVIITHILKKVFQ